MNYSPNMGQKRPWGPFIKKPPTNVGNIKNLGSPNIIELKFRSLQMANFWVEIFVLGRGVIFVISFTRAELSENKNLHRKTHKLQKRISRQNSVNQDLLGQATKKCVKLHTECKSTLGLCKNKIIHTNYTKCVKLHTECKCCVMLDGCKWYTHCINHTHLCNKRCV